MSIIVSVRSQYSTYVAKSGKTTASCTAGERQAVERLAGKLFGDLQRVEITFLERIGHGESEWSIRPDTTQRCRACGCTYDRACQNGCHWVEADLCSRCFESPVLSGLDRTTSGAIGQP